MSENNQNKNTSEEIDLGQLFRLIGDGLSKFFNFLWRAVKWIFDLLIQFILFIRRHFIKFAIAAIVGAVIGFFLDREQEITFSANLIVQPNFGSTAQLYKNIQYYNNLVQQGDTTLLISTFGIPPEEASSLRSFYIRPVENENSTLEAYNKLLTEAKDSSVIKKYSYEEFKKNIAQYDYRIHEVGVVSLKNNIFRKLQPVIIASVTENKYFDTKKRITLENLDRSDSILRNAMVAIDSLRNVYTDVLLANAKRENPQGSTSIVLSETGKRTNELELFNTEIRFKNELNANEVQRAESSEVINVISGFQPIGYRVSILYKKYYFIFGVAGVAIMFLYLMLRELNVFLNSYQNRNED